MNSTFSAVKNCYHDPNNVKVRIAGAVVEKAEKMLPGIPEEDKEEVINLIESIQDSLKNSTYTNLSSSIEELTEVLFYLEV